MGAVAGRRGSGAPGGSPRSSPGRARPVRRAVPFARRPPPAARQPPAGSREIVDEPGTKNPARPVLCSRACPKAFPSDPRGVRFVPSSSPLPARRRPRERGARRPSRGERRGRHRGGSNGRRGRTGGPRRRLGGGRPRGEGPEWSPRSTRAGRPLGAARARRASSEEQRASSDEQHEAIERLPAAGSRARHGCARACRPEP